MIPVHPRKAAPARPRWGRGGFAPNWNPVCPPAVDVPFSYPEPVVAQEFPVSPMPASRFARSLLPPPLEIAPATTQSVRMLFLPGVATGIAAEEAHMGKAVSYPIGWFDLSLFLDLIDASSKEEKEEGGGSSSNSSVPKDDLARRLAALLQPPLSALYAPQGVLDWPAPFLDYQRDGITTLLARRELLLADDMGLGKSIQAIAALRILFYQQQIESALLVCPASLLAQWRREFAKWAPDLRIVVIAGTPADRGSLWGVPAHVRLVGYETLRADVLDVADSPLLRHTWGVVALDEASRIKNRDSAITIACKRLQRERRWALTGTPLENSIEDLISILEFLTGEPGRPRSIPSSPRALRTELQRLQLRRRKADVLRDLPPKLVDERILELSPAQRAAYDAAEKEGIFQLRSSHEKVTLTHVLELISRLKQLCNVDPVSGESAKLTDIVQRLPILIEEGHRALIFSQFTDDTFGLGYVARVLAPFQPLVYTGSLSLSRRAEIVDRFLSDRRYKALLLSVRAGGVGLNLQAASYIFHLDRWWNPAIEDQADSRAHRMGQTYPVTILRYICANTIEERIDRTLTAKRKMFQEVVDDVSLDLSSALTEEELFGLFGLTSPRPRRP